MLKPTTSSGGTTLRPEPRNISTYAKKALIKARQARSQGDHHSYSATIHESFEKVTESLASLQTDSAPDLQKARAIVARAENRKTPSPRDGRMAKEAALTALSTLGAGSGLPASTAASALSRDLLSEAALASASRLESGVAMELMEHLQITPETAVGGDFSGTPEPSSVREWQMGQFLNVSLDGDWEKAQEVAKGRFNGSAGKDLVKLQVQNYATRGEFESKFPDQQWNRFRVDSEVHLWDFLNKGGGPAAFLLEEDNELKYYEGKVVPTERGSALFTLAEDPNRRKMNGNFIEAIAVPRVK